jgi:hypothetical protein
LNLLIALGDPTLQIRYLFTLPSNLDEGKKVLFMLGGELLLEGCSEGSSGSKGMTWMNSVSGNCAEAGSFN